MKKLIFLTCCLFAGLALIAQSAGVDTLTQSDYVVTPDTTVNDLLTMYTLLYAALVNVLTYISSFYKPALKVKPALRALVIGLITGLIFYSLGIANGWQLAFGFIAAALNYDKILKPVGLETKKESAQK